MNTPDFWNMIAVERGMPEGWRWWSIQTIGDRKAPREHAAAMVKGGVPVARFASGKRKGEINWAKATSKAEMVITFRDLDERMARWERETGNCKTCGGDGQELAGWSAAEGSRTRECRRCKGSGKAPIAEAA